MIHWTNSQSEPWGDGAEIVAKHEAQAKKRAERMQMHVLLAMV